MLIIALAALVILIPARGFVFRSPTVTYADSTINVATQYVLTLQRQFTPALTPTAFATQAVPAGATITVTFPS